MADVNKTVQINIKGDASKLNKSLSGAKAGFANLAKGMAAASAAIAGVAVAFGALNQQVADYVNDLVDASTKTGVATKSLAALQLAAEGSGRSFGVIEGGLIKFQQAQAMAAEGSKKQAQAFDQLGVAVMNSDGSLRKTNDVFNDAIRSLSEMEAGTERNILTMDLFGRTSGSALTQSGAIDSMDLFLQKVESFGLDVGPKATEEAARWQRAMADLGMVTRRASQDMVSALSGKGSPASALEHLGGALVFLKSIAVDVFGFISNLVRTAFGAVQSVVMAIMKTDFGAIGSRMNDLLMVKNLADIPAAWGKLSRQIDKSGKVMLDLNRPNEKMLNQSIDNMSSLLTRATGQYSKFMGMANMTADAGGGQGGRPRGRGASAAAASKSTRKQISQNQTLLQLQKEVDAIMSKSNERTLSQSEKIREQYGAQIERLKEIQRISQDKLNTEEAQFQIRKDMEDELTKIRKENIEKLKEEQEKALVEEGKLYEAEMQRKISILDNYGKAVTGYLSNFGSALQTTMENTGNLTETHARRLHRLQQFAGIGEVAINSAVAVMKAYAQFGPIGGALASIPMAALAGVQTAAILSQPPPKFHTGGMVDGPDVVNAQLLKGEAVLDRSTVRRIGGKEAVEKIGSPSEVIVVNSFKHFDRYVASSMRGNSRLRKLVPNTGRRF